MVARIPNQSFILFFESMLRGGGDENLFQQTARPDPNADWLAPLGDALTFPLRISCFIVTMLLTSAGDLNAVAV